MKRILVSTRPRGVPSKKAIKLVESDITGNFNTRVRGICVVRKIFCDICGHELTTSEAIQLLGHELCASCCKKLVPQNGAHYKTESGSPQKSVLSLADPKNKLKTTINHAKKAYLKEAEEGLIKR